MTEPTTRAIQDLLDSVTDRLAPDRRHDVAVYLDHREWESAADLIGEGISETDSKLTDDEKDQFKRILSAIDVPVSEYDYLDLD